MVHSLGLMVCKIGADWKFKFPTLFVWCCEGQIVIGTLSQTSSGNFLPFFGAGEIATIVPYCDSQRKHHDNTYLNLSYGVFGIHMNVG